MWGRYNFALKVAGVAELVDAPDSKSGFFGSASSILALGTNLISDQNISLIFNNLNSKSRDFGKQQSSWVFSGNPVRIALRCHTFSFF